jgi:OOP family OmpA-OmpF porin
MMSPGFPGIRDYQGFNPPYYSLLDEIGMVLKGSLPSVKVILAGHADSTGTEKYNHDLSLKRAKAVRKYLLKRQGIAPERIDIQAYGENEPVASNNSEKGRAFNRRVDMIGVGGEW